MLLPPPPPPLPTPSSRSCSLVLGGAGRAKRLLSLSSPLIRTGERERERERHYFQWLEQEAERPTELELTSWWMAQEEEEEEEQETEDGGWSHGTASIHVHVYVQEFARLVQPKTTRPVGSSVCFFANKLLAYLYSMYASMCGRWVLSWVSKYEICTSKRERKRKSRQFLSGGEKHLYTALSLYVFISKRLEPRACIYYPLFAR